MTHSGNLEDRTHEHSNRTDLREPKLSLLADFEALHKDEVKARTELLTASLSVKNMPGHKHKLPWQKQIYWFLVFKQIYVQSLVKPTIREESRDFSDYIRKNTDFTELLQKSLNDKTTKMSSNNKCWKGGEPDF